ncbi:MAG: hypothetical protein SGPRY_010983, partial [Prymnesium sp.]
AKAADEEAMRALVAAELAAAESTHAAQLTEVEGRVRQARIEAKASTQAALEAAARADGLVVAAAAREEEKGGGGSGCGRGDERGWEGIGGEGRRGEIGERTEGRQGALEAEECALASLMQAHSEEIARMQVRCEEACRGRAQAEKERQAALALNGCLLELNEGRVSAKAKLASFLLRRLGREALMRKIWSAWARVHASSRLSTLSARVEEVESEYGEARAALREAAGARGEWGSLETVYREEVAQMEVRLARAEADATREAAAAFWWNICR